MIDKKTYEVQLNNFLKSKTLSSFILREYHAMQIMELTKVESLNRRYYALLHIANWLVNGL